MMKSMRTRLTVVYVGLMVLLLITVWGVNRWYLEKYYISQKMKALNVTYDAIDRQIAENRENGR